MTEFKSDFPDLWSDISLRPYLGEVKRRHGVVETLALPSMRDLPPVQIETLFVPPLLAQVTVSADSDPELWPPGRTLLSELQDLKQLVVLGDPGGGKTTLSNWLAWRLAAGLSSPLPEILQNRVPIPCVLRDMPVELFRFNVTLVDLVCSVADKILGSRATSTIKNSLSNRIATGAYVLILDGIDEIPLSHRQVVAGWIRAASEQEGCVLATSRIIGYEDCPVDGLDVPISNIVSEKFSDKNLETKYSPVSNYIDISRKVYSNFSPDESIDSREPKKWAHIRYLMPFDQGRIAAFAENWYQQRCMTQQEAVQKTMDLLAALSQSEVTQKLARTPNLLSLMAIVHRERADLPDGKALLYEEIANAYINTIDKQRKITPGDILSQYGWKDRKAWLSYVGFRMQSARGRSGDRDTGILADEGDVEQWLADAMAVSGVSSPLESAKTFLNWVARRSGLLLPRGEARYAFVHLSFQEYFCACYLESCIVRPAFIKDRLPSDADVTKEKLVEWSNEAHWPETLIFLFELLSAERDSEWVDDVVHIIFGSKVDDFLPYGRAAEVASRVIKNKHIKISPGLRDGLAASIGSKALSEWEGGRLTPDSGVFSSLLYAGYAAIVGKAPKLSKKIDKSLLSFCVDRVESVVSPERVCILVIETNEEVDLNILRKFVNVKYLRIKGALLTKSEALSCFVGLSILQLVSLPLTEINSLAKMTRLYHVELHDMVVADISPLSKLKDVHTLELHDLNISSLDPIQKLKNLLYLSLKNLHIQHLNALSAIKGITTLYLENIQLSDLSFAAPLKKLQHLRAVNLPIEDFSPLHGLKKLFSLDLRGMSFEDLTSIGEMNNLQSLYISECELSSLEPLRKLSALRGLVLTDLQISDIAFISDLKKISTCFISDVGIKDLAPLASLSQLFYLSLDLDEMPDLAPLGKCARLKFLDIYCRSSIDVLPLCDLSELRNVHLKSAGIENLQVLEAVEGVTVRWDLVS